MRPGVKMPRKNRTGYFIIERLIDDENIRGTVYYLSGYPPLTSNFTIYHILRNFDYPKHEMFKDILIELYGI